MNWVFESLCFYLDLLVIALDLCASSFPFSSWLENVLQVSPSLQILRVCSSLSLFLYLCEFGFCILGIRWIVVSTIFFITWPNALFFSFSFSFSQGHSPFNWTKLVLRILRVWPGRRHPCRVALAGNYLRQFVVFCNNGWNAIWCSVLFENIFGVIVVLFSNLDSEFWVLVGLIVNILSNLCQ